MQERTRQEEVRAERTVAKGLKSREDLIRRKAQRGSQQEEESAEMTLTGEERKEEKRKDLGRRKREEGGPQQEDSSEWALAGEEVSTGKTSARVGESKETSAGGAQRGPSHRNRTELQYTCVVQSSCFQGKGWAAPSRAAMKIA